MKVKDLIQELKWFDPEAEVHFSYNYGDYWRTQVAAKAENIDEGFVEYSDYHQMSKVVDVDYDSDEEPQGESVVIISA